MNSDFRVAVSFPHHPKTIKLIRRLGSDAIYSLLQLWAFVSVNKPDGVLNNMGIEDIEIASGWNGQCSKFVLALLECKFLNKIDSVYHIHDWKDHNGYAFYSPQRSEKAKKAAEARWGKRNKNRMLMPDDANSMLQASPSNAPSPNPNPNPNPYPKPKPKPKKKRKFSQEEFDKFYSAYPNTGSKKPALERWKKLWLSFYLRVLEGYALNREYNDKISRRMDRSYFLYFILDRNYISLYSEG